MDTSLSQKIINVASNYLGPTAERFISRQATTHLHKSIEKIEKTDIKELADWSKVAIGLVTKDKTVVDNFYNDLISISK